MFTPGGRWTQFEEQIFLNGLKPPTSMIFILYDHIQWRIIMYHLPMSLDPSVFLAATPLPHGMASANIWHHTTSGSKLKCHRLLVFFTCSIMPPATGFSPKKPMKTASAIAPSCRARLWLNLVSSTTQTRLQTSFNHCPKKTTMAKLKSSMMRGHQWWYLFTQPFPGVLGGPSISIHTIQYIHLYTMFMCISKNYIYIMCIYIYICLSLCI